MRIKHYRYIVFQLINCKRMGELEQANKINRTEKQKPCGVEINFYLIAKQKSSV